MSFYIDNVKHFDIKNEDMGDEQFPIGKVLARIRRFVARKRAPICTEIAETARDPFKILISCILSLRTKDKTTAGAAERLFARGSTPEQILAVPGQELEKLIYPVGFYRNKAASIRDICRVLREEYHGKVPDSLEELLKLKGVGRKTANLVLTLGFRKYGICVDTHVHRISNRLGYIRTKTPHETEFMLRAKLPKRYWIEYNDLLVTFGQNLCKPVSPHCSICPVKPCCKQAGVKIHR